MWFVILLGLLLVAVLGIGFALKKWRAKKAEQEKVTGKETELQDVPAGFGVTSEINLVPEPVKLVTSPNHAA